MWETTCSASSRSRRSRRGGVDVRGVRVLPAVPTAATLIINVKGEDRRFIHAAGANAAMTADGIPTELITQCKVLYVGGYLLMPPLEKPGTLVSFFRRRGTAGAQTVLDVVVPGPGDHWHKFEEILPETDVFLPNSDEAELITGLADPVDQADEFRAAGAKTVVITQGERGTLLVEEGRRCVPGSIPRISSAAPAQATRSTRATSRVCSPAKIRPDACGGVVRWEQAASDRSARPRACLIARRRLSSCGVTI